MSEQRKRLFFGSAILAAITAAAFATTTAAAKDGSQERPQLPNERTYDGGSDHFLIHYTLSGGDAIAPTDANGNGVPDYVETVLDALNTAWQVEIVQMGWAPPPLDRGEGGDTRFDVYLQNLMPQGIAGYAESGGGYVGDNPLTPEVERRAAYSYLVLDNDYAELLNEPTATETPLQLLQATVAHEFNHVIQAGYDDFDPQFWLYEATASWMEDEVFDESNDTVYYIPDIFNAPDTCRIAESGWYGSWLFMRLMSERYGREVVRSIWEHSREMDGYASIDAALAAYGSSLEGESRDFAVANLLRAYQEGATYPAVRLEGSTGQGIFTPQTGVQSLGSDTVQLTGSGVVDVSLLGGDGLLSLRAVGVRGDQADVIDVQGGALTINLDAYQDAYVIVHNDSRANQEQDCVDTGYSLQVAASSQPPTAVAAVWQAGNFTPPQAAASVGGPAPAGSGSAQYHPPADQPFAQGEVADTPQELDVSFQPIIPVTLPPGYTFDYASVMTAEDFGSSAIYYVPGGGESANYDYRNDSGNWLSIAQSPSPYATPQEWMDAINYDSPGEIKTISGVEVLVEDLSDQGNVWISATFILDGLFVVVDGDHSTEDVVALVKGMIAARAVQPVATDAFPTPALGGEQPPPAAPVTGDYLTLGLIVGIGLCGLGVCLAAIIVPLAVFFLRRRPSG